MLAATPFKRGFCRDAFRAVNIISIPQHEQTLPYFANRTAQPQSVSSDTALYNIVVFSPNTVGHTVSHVADRS
jgi:hypothetical protein